jgi:hypothetical protein
MKPAGPMTEAVLRFRKLQAQSQAVAEALTLAFQSAADAELARSVLAALVRLKEEGKPKQGVTGFIAEHWLAYQILFGPAVLSAATLRAARIVEGTSGAPAVIGLPRRANDFPEVTPLGLRFFYQACLGQGRPGSFDGLGELFENLRLDGLMQGQPMQPSLADALLLGLLPGLSAQAQGLLLSGEEHHAELVRDLLGMADLLAGLRLGRLPTSLPEGEAGLARALHETEAVHGLFYAALRANVSQVGPTETWPPLIGAFVHQRIKPGTLLATHPAPLFVCTLAAAWLKLTYRGQAPDLKVAFLGEFKALIARCPHPQAAALERMLNSAIA